MPLGTTLQVTVHNVLDRPMRLRGLQARAGLADLDSLTLAAGTEQGIRFTADVPGTYYYWVARSRSLPFLAWGVAGTPP